MRPSSSFSRAVVALILLGPLGANLVPAQAGPDDRLEGIDRAQRRIERRLERTQEVGARLARKISSLDARHAELEAALDELDDQIAGLDLTIGRLEDRLGKAQRHFAALSERIEVIEARLSDRERLFHERAIFAYKTGATSAFDALLSSTSLPDLIERFTYFQSALDADADVLAEIKALEEELARRREQVADRKEQIAADKLALQETRARLSQVRDRRAEALAARRSAIAHKKAVLAGVRARQSRLRDVQRQLRAESDRIEALLAARAAGGTVALDAGGRLAWPTTGPVTSGFGYRVHPLFGDRRMHTGVDIAAPHGAPVYAAGAGVVAYVGTLGGYGQVVAIDHGGGLATTYNHLSATYVFPGEAVGRGQHIASVGCTGFCTGPHLHFEVRVNGSPVDPMPYLG